MYRDPYKHVYLSMKIYVTLITVSYARQQRNMENNFNFNLSYQNVFSLHKEYTNIFALHLSLKTKI